jgi:hypothetical protein
MASYPFRSLYTVQSLCASFPHRAALRRASFVNENNKRQQTRAQWKFAALRRFRFGIRSHTLPIAILHSTDG